MGPNEIGKFGRRITSWLVLFYRNEDDNLKIITPAIEKLSKDFNGILEIARVNCEKNAEFCWEFLVYGTPKLFIFPSFSGMEAEEFNIEGYLELLEQN